MSPTDPTGRKKPEMTPSVANRASSAPLRMRTFSPASAAIALASSGPLEARQIASVPGDVDSRDPHRVGDGAKPPRSFDRSAKAVRRDGPRFR